MLRELPADTPDSCRERGSSLKAGPALRKKRQGLPLPKQKRALDLQVIVVCGLDPLRR